MIFDPDFFRKISVKKEQTDALFKGAKRSLELALNSKEDEIILHFCYNAVIKLGIAVIAKKGYKVRSIPGHHVKILEALAGLENLKTEIKYIDNIRKKRNIDLYEGEISLTNKEAAELIKITKKIFQSIEKNTDKNGFTLVELMVSVGITAILMLGITTFFSSTFRNMFAAREEVASTQEQFAANTILGGKFVNVDRLQELDPAPGPISSYAVLRNDMETGDLPFTYIGKEEINGAEHIVFKDFFVFNGRDDFWESYAETDLENPAGIAVLGGNAFISVPMEDEVYKCMDTPGNCSEPLDMSALELPLDQPMDITSNASDTIYFSDAGNGRILEITLPGDDGQNIRVVASGFNYPTGLAYYQPADTAYLFVADTYNNQVKKVRISDGNTEVVVGDGDDEVCDPSDGRDHTALYCKLSFPTGLMVANDSGVDSLYIADTGNGRVLRVWDPMPEDLAAHEILATIKGSTAIKNIDFVFPNDVTINGISEGAPNDLPHSGRFEIDGNTVHFDLFAPMINDNTQLVIECTDPPDPVCTPHNYFIGFDIAENDNIFETGDLIDINGDAYSVASISGADPVTVGVNEFNTENAYPDGTTVQLTNTFSGVKKFYLNLENIDFLSPFNLITTEIYDTTDTLNNDPADFQTLRIGDGELGTSEDTIEVAEIEGETVHDFPTGLGWLDGAPQVSASPQYFTNFPNYDYISDFEVHDQDFGFSEPNPGEILEMIFKAKIGEDADGNPVWTENTLNANIKE
ncbi:prepilin-type N-terminal cleavage/methylation domain-containing protein [Patescibacteria group bacterium]|nr:prepilin-type N-terminal cleavage/methylation domain-containing protein [Patescibacteria group bacterium]MBU1016238.1 prepilin-type N-terminal cleavage/methylation domain-containing protein [Patescibacteria group bacterium]